MKPEKLIYTFVSFASYIDKDWGHGVPESGIECMAKLVHKYDIPITWIVNSRSSEVMGNRINLWHSQYDDNIILWIPAHFSDYDPAYDKRELEKGLIREWSIIEKIFPWADIKVAASGYIDNNMINVLEKLNFQGLWGYCWEQTWWDGITHKGVPWGAWYIDSNRWKVPHTAKGQLVACEWTARDLNSTFHTGSPAVYSTDPDDVLRSGLCTGENIEYWKKLFCDYLLNTDNNEYVFFLQHQESHEMDESKEFSLYPHDHIMETADMLDKFLEYISGFGVTAMNLPCAIKFYKTVNAVTPPCYMLTKDSGIRPQTNQYTLTLGGIPEGPWPETFLYYDTECQMAFRKGECKPYELRSYVGKSRMDTDFHEEIPMVFIQKYEKTEEQIVLEFLIDQCPPLPFGLVYWDDLSGYKVMENEGGTQEKIIQNHLVFIKVKLNGYRKKVRLVLVKKALEISDSNPV